MLVFQSFAFGPQVFAQISASGGDEGAGSEPPPVQQQSGQYQPTQRGVTVYAPINLRQAAREEALAPAQPTAFELRPVHPPKDGPNNVPTVTITPTGDNGTGAEGEEEPGRELSPPPTVASPPPTKGFRTDELVFGSIPPDTMGAVGPNHVITTTNEKVIIHKRTGVKISTVSLNTFWSGVTLEGGAAPSTFDPKVYYDRFNNRYILISTTNAQTLSSATLFAVSQTGDPTGTWNRYSVDADPTATATGGNWADYPSVGYNKNWIVVQINMFGFGTLSGYQGPAIYVLDKQAAYAGTLSSISAFQAASSACTVVTDLGCGFSMAPAITEDNTTETEYLVESWSSTAGQLRMSKLTGTPSTPVLTVGIQFPQSTFSWRGSASIISGSGGYAPQRQQNAYLPSGTRIANNDHRMQNAVLRNGSLWCTHTVMVAATPTPAGTAVGGTTNPDIRSTVQWWQINPAIEDSVNSTPPLQRARIEDPTADNCHDGAGNNRTGCTTANQRGDFYAFPNISVNKNNDVLIGYSRFSALTYGNAAYSFRANTDSPNTTRDPMIMRPGVGNYNIGAGTPFTVRWGDYSAAMTDPVDDTNFWTIQEFADYQKFLFPSSANPYAGSWATWWSQVKIASTTSTAGNLIISEFRLRGPAGPRDEFVELYNPSDSPLTVTTSDGSDGWALSTTDAATGLTNVALTVIPNGTTIPARGHLLISNEVRAVGVTPYSLNNYPNTQIRLSDGDVMWTPDIPDNTGVAIFRTANTANFSLATRMDAAGFASLANPATLYKEGNGIPAISAIAPVGNYSFYRDLRPTGLPKDTNANENDFIFVDTSNETLTVTPNLGGPGPENVDSPITRSASTEVQGNPIEPLNSVNVAPNRVRDTTPFNYTDPTTGATRSFTLGTLSIRRRFQNLTGKPISRLRFRIMDTTSGPASTTPPAGTADLRALTSNPFLITTSLGTITVQGTVLEQPPNYATGGTAEGGGWNSSMGCCRTGSGVAGVTEQTINLDNQLPHGGTIDLQFLLGVVQGGSFRFFVNIEAVTEN